MVQKTVINQNLEDPLATYASIFAVIPTFIHITIMNICRFRKLLDSYTYLAI